MPANFNSPLAGPSAVSQLPHTPNLAQHVSPATRRSVALTSPALAALPAVMPGDVQADNDDQAEKRQRRRSRLLELQRKNLASPGTPPSDRHRATPLSGLSNAQLTDHYANCIKLSAENKINAKNAFGLHLIDYMTDLLRKKEMTNFQVASSTLDASAKIYAGRVDAIHSETYKVLTGLGRGANKGKDDADGEAGDEASEGEQMEPEKKKKRRARKSRATVETNLKNINVKKFDLEFEVDPLFQKMSLAFDEGGSGGLLLNHLSCLDHTSELFLDSNTVVPGLEERAKSIEEVHGRSMVDLSEFRDTYSGVNWESLQICPQFANFEFTNWNRESDSTFSNLASRLQGKGDHAFDLEAEPEPLLVGGSGDAQSVHNDFEDYDDDGGDGVPCDEGERPGQATFFGDTSEAKMVESAFENMKHGSVGTLMQILATEPSDYSYFKADLLRTWAGPQHWKFNPKFRDPNAAGVLDDRGKKGEKRKAEPYRIDYNAEVDSDEKFKETRAATALTKTTLDKYSRVTRTRPEDLHYEPEKLFKVFHKSKVMVRRQKRANTEDIDNAIDTYDYDNANDRDNFCPAGLEGGDDPQADDDDDHDGCFELTAGSELEPSQASFIGDGTAVGDNLVEQPRKVAKIDIGYARTAKKIDVRKLKSTMWSLLCKTDKNKKVVEQNEEDRNEEKDQEETSTSKESAGDMTFTEMVEELPAKVAKSMAKNLSVPIAFVCLLHLANEKTLKITNNHAMTDLHISQD